MLQNPAGIFGDIMKQLVVKTRLKIDQDELHFRRYKIFISVKDVGVIIKNNFLKSSIKWTNYPWELTF